MGKHIEIEKQKELVSKIRRIPFNYQGIIDKAGVSTRTFYRFLDGHRVRKTTFKKIESAIS